MQATVSGELAHIPKWPGEHQNKLRMLYNSVRRASLGRTATGAMTANEVLQECIAWLTEIHPGAEVCYDKEFFEGSDKRNPQ
jgi:hypothetical protein